MRGGKARSTVYTSGTAHQAKLGAISTSTAQLASTPASQAGRRSDSPDRWPAPSARLSTTTHGVSGLARWCVR